MEIKQQDMTVSRECKLCKQTNELQDSHYLPKRLYAYHQSDELSNPSPIVIVNGELKQVNDQLRGYVFCKTCEDKFNKGGEAWVLKNIPHGYNEPFPLHKALEPIRPLEFGDASNLYDLSGQPGIDLQKLIYFGLSIFWRGAAHHWKSTLGLYAPQLELGSNFEPLRQFILGSGGVPDTLALTLDIWPYKQVLGSSFPPHPNDLEGCKRYWFYIPGLLYTLLLGPGIPKGFLNRKVTNGIVAVDKAAALSVLEFATDQMKSSKLGPQIKAMFQEIETIRSQKSSKE